jgi:cell division protein FtsZ
VKTVLTGMGTAMMGTGEASGDRRAVVAAEEAISNPLLDDVTLKGAKGLLVSIIGGHDLTLYEVDEAATRVRQEVDPEANIIVGATFDESLGDRVRVSIVASGMLRKGTLGAGPGTQKMVGGGRESGPPPMPGLSAHGAAGPNGAGDWNLRLAEALTPSQGATAKFTGPMVAAGPQGGPVGAVGRAQGSQGGGADLSQQIAAVRSSIGSNPTESAYGDAQMGRPQAALQSQAGVPDINAFPEIGQKAWNAAYGQTTGETSVNAAHQARDNEARSVPPQSQKVSLLQRIRGAGRANGSDNGGNTSAASGRSDMPGFIARGG